VSERDVVSCNEWFGVRVAGKSDSGCMSERVSTGAASERAFRWVSECVCE
jgi:hypothetical protein